MGGGNGPGKLSLWHLRQVDLRRPIDGAELEVELSGARLAAALAAPPDPGGWVVLASGRPEDGPQVLAAAHALHRVGLGTLTVRLGEATSDPSDVVALANELREARRWLAEREELGGAGIGLAGAGLGGAVALVAASAAAVDRDRSIPALIIWNGRLEVARPLVERLAFPGLLLSDRDRGWAERRSDRRVARLLGPLAQLEISASLEAEGEDLIRDWYGGLVTRSVTPASVSRTSRTSHAVRGRAVALAAAVAVTIPAAMGGSAAAASGRTQEAFAGRFAGSRVLSARHISGDGFAARSGARAFTSSSAGRFGGKKLGRRHLRGDGFSAKPDPTGGVQLVDQSGVKYFINTDITFSTSSSASGAMSEASYTHAVNATTSAGGTTAATLNDAFDGYNAMAVFLGANPPSGPVHTGGPFTIYNKNGASPTSECLGANSNVNRQLDFPTQVVGSIDMSRKVYVPDDDNFARWMNVFTNTGATAQEVTMYTSNNLGSDANTVITGSSNGDTTADLTDTWVSTFQNYSGTTSSDPRLAHVMQGPGRAVGLSQIHFQNGDDNPFWAYTFTLQPGQTGIILNYVVVKPSKAASMTKAGELVGLPPSSLECMTLTEQHEVLNFHVPKAKVSVAVSSSDPVSTQGEDVTFTATVCPLVSGSPPVPTGTVHFQDHHNHVVTAIGSASLSPGGGDHCAQAFTHTSSLALGKHKIVARYGGDTNYSHRQGSTIQYVKT